MGQYLELSDQTFSEPLTLREAYLTMVQFLAAYRGRGQSDTGTLLADIGVGLWADQGSADPVQLYDFVAAFRALKQQRG